MLALIKFIIFTVIVFIPGNIKSDPLHGPYFLLLLKQQSTKPLIPLDELPRTGQIVCYDITSSYDIVPCEGTGQDGESKAGVPWPTPRFVASTSNSSIDQLTGLEWTNERDAPGPTVCLPNESKTWSQALDHIKCLNQNNYLGYSDWRLPNTVEFSSLFNAKIDESFAKRFDQSSRGSWWTSTTRLNNPTFAVISLAEGGYNTYRLKTEVGRVWPVRSSTSGAITLPKSGQSGCYDSDGVSIDCTDTGQDGETLTGRSWPEPRFTDNGDETILDNLAGIIWTKNTNYPHSEICSPGTTDFISTLNYIKCLNDNEFLGYKDWRLPNELEVRSLSNSGIPSSERSNWLSTFGFYNFSSVYVQTWSSTVEDSYGYPIGIWVGGGHWDVTFQSGHAWPIRGGYFSD